MRLIDADRLIETIKGTDTTYNPHFTILLNSLINLVNEQPTSYDVNKVVERLQYAKNPYSDIDLRQYNNALDFAVAVVKRGGN